MQGSVPAEMRCLMASRSGSPSEVLSVVSTPAPQTCGETDVIVRVRAAGLNPVDWKAMGGWLPMSFKFPRPFGFDFAGEVVARGGGVSGYALGDAVYGKLQGFDRGAQTEYIRVNTATDCVTKKPEHVTFEEAGGVGVAALTAYVTLVREAGMDADKPSKKVLLIGASGGVGCYALQIGRALGCHITAVCSARNEQLVRSLGAQEVMDYTASPLEQQLAGPEFADAFDLVYDCVGGDDYWTLAQRVLKPSGVFVTIVGPQEHGGRVTAGVVVSLLGKLAWRRLFASRRYVLQMDLPTPCWQGLHALIEAKQVRPPPTQAFPLQEGVRAYEVSCSHRATGKVVVCP